jgi:hypothetical protein
MGGQQGYSKVTTNNLVFSYDTGDPVNSFKGKPTTNILTTITDNQGTVDTTYFKSNYGSETSNIPGLGGLKTVRYCNIYNDYPNSGNCCPSLFYYGDFTTGVSANTQYVYQIIYKTQNGYANANYMYRYELNGGTTVGEVGVWDSSREEDLGNGWKHAWGTFTTSGTTTRLICYSFHYEYATYNKLQIAGISLTQGTSVLRPRQFLGVGVTRSTTQGLLNLSNPSTTIDLTNVSFDTSGSIVFDGTDDYINTNFPSQTITNVTIEAIVYDTRNSNSYRAIVQNNLNSDDALYIYPNNTLGFWPCGGGSLNVPANQWNHVVASYDGSTIIYSVNGVFQTVSTVCSDITNWEFLRIGAHGVGDSERWGGQISVAKIYNRALTQSEITQNYNHYKTRFSLT